MSSPLFLELEGTAYSATLVIDSVVAGRSAGGVRIAPGIARGEVAELAREMTLKYSLFRLPRGGAKTGIDLDRELPSEERIRVLEEIGRGFAPVIRTGLYYPGMDMNCGPVELQAIYRGAGISIGPPTDTSFFTALTVAACVKAVADGLSAPSPVTLAIEGFGSVGRHLAAVLPPDRFRVTAVATLAGAVRNPEGFGAGELVDAKDAHGDALVHHLQGEPTDRRGVLVEPVDILLPSSRTRAVSMAIAGDVRARAVVPIANAPYESEALSILIGNGVLCLPGYLANSGGVLASSLYDSGMSQSEVEHFMATRFRRTVASLIARSNELDIPVAKAAGSIAEAEAGRRRGMPLELPLGAKVLRRLEPRLPRRWKALRARSRFLTGLDALEKDIAALGSS